MAKIKKKKNSTAKAKQAKPEAKTSQKEVKKAHEPEKKTQDSKKSHDYVKESNEKFIDNINLPLLKKALPILLILIVMWIAFFVRAGPVELSGLEERVEANTYNNIRNLLSQQIDQQYPNLNPSYKQELLDEEFAKVVDTGRVVFNDEVIEIAPLVQSNVNSVRSAFQAENGQTYLNAIDPYHFLKLAENVQKTGHMGTTLKVDSQTGEQRPFVEYKVAPEGIYVQDKVEFHVWLESKLLDMRGLDENSPFGEKIAAVFLLPVIFAMLSAIPIFLLIRKYSNDFFAFMGALLLVSIGTFVSRTIAGFVDTDAYNVFFPLLVVASLVYAFVYKDKKLIIALAAIAGFFQGMFLWAWGAGWFIFLFLVFSLLGYIGYVILLEIIHKEKIFSESVINSISVLGTYFISSMIFTYLFVQKNLISQAFHRTETALQEGLKGATSGNIWPNVLSSVAELNSASFNAIMNSVGGKIIFLIALLGLVLFIVSEIQKRRKDLALYSWGITAIALVWYLAIVFGGAFAELTVNSRILFLALLFLPLGASLALALFANLRTERVLLVILLSVWIGGTIFMSLTGVRFILLLAPAFAISFALGLYAISDIVNSTKGLAICGYPVRDLDRLLSFYIAAKNTNRDLVIDMKQAYLLKLFSESDNLKGQYPSPTDKNIKIYIQRGSWGLIDKDIDIFTQKQLYQDYGKWQREFLDYPNAVDYRDIAKNQNQYIFYCSDFRLQDLIDVKPSEGATYIRSLTEPFNTEMEIKEDQVKNWMVHFGILNRDQDWHQIHVSGHGDGEQIKYVVENTGAKSLIPIHTVNDEYHKKWHKNVKTVNQHGTHQL